MTEPIGIYIHIPFCKRRCNYCDFCSGVRGEVEISLYVDRLVEEIRTSPYSARGLAADSVFFGGGTPSLLTSEQLGRILLAIRENFNILPKAEITLEVNPATAKDGWYSEIFALGVNRISLGVQSIHEIELKTLGRIHSYEDFEHSFKAARKAGFSNISVDIMYGIPHQSRRSLSMTLDKILALSPEHISPYGLIIEEGTPFFDAKDTLPLPSAECERDMYFLIDERLTASGYLHYEISNFARAGFECRHNLKYWTLVDYIGFGVSAHSCMGRRRFYNTDSFGSYITDDFGKTTFTECEYACGEEEYIMLRLRLARGIDFDDFKARFGKNLEDIKRREIDTLLSHGLLVRTERGIALTPRGFYLSNSVIVTLLT